ncbi:hypothetical protein [Novacetimonas pomaceti]|nr:hypothetical protein [Novacetimonas pomaceti]
MAPTRNMLPVAPVRYCAGRQHGHRRMDMLARGMKQGPVHAMGRAGLTGRMAVAPPCEQGLVQELSR